MCVWDHLKCSSNHTRSSTCSSWKFALLDKAANTFLELCLDYAIRGATEHSRNFGSFFLTYVWVACLFCSEQISSRMEEEAVRPTVWFNYEVGVFLKQTRLFETLLVVHTLRIDFHELLCVTIYSTCIVKCVEPLVLIGVLIRIIRNDSLVSRFVLYQNKVNVYIHVKFHLSSNVCVYSLNKKKHFICKKECTKISSFKKCTYK